MGGYGMGLGAAREAMIPLAGNPQGVQQGMAGALSLAQLLQQTQQQRQAFPGQMRLQQQRIQGNQMALDQAQQQQADQQGIGNAFQDAKGDTDKFLANLANPKYPISVAGRQRALQSVYDTRQKYFQMSDDQRNYLLKQADAVQGVLDSLGKANSPDQLMGLWQRGAPILQQAGLPLPQRGQNVQQWLKGVGMLWTSHKQFLNDTSPSYVTAKPGETVYQVPAGGGQPTPFISSPATPKVEDQELADFLKKNPGKGAADFAAWKARLNRDPNAAADRQFREGQQSYQYSSNALDKVGQPIEQLVARMGRLKDSLAQANPQADALIAPELLTVMAGGQGSGLRMNEAEISRIVGGRNAWQSLKSTIDRWQADPSKPFLITPVQRGQINALIDAVNGKLQTKQQILDDARQSLANSNDPMQHRQILTRARNRLMSIDQGQGGGGGIKPNVTHIWTPNGLQAVGGNQ